MNKHEFEKIVTVSPAFDKRHPNPSKNYGIGSCQITFILKGPKGAVQFMIGTDWYLPEVQREQRDFNYNHDVRFDRIQPQGWDVGYHAYEPQFEGQDSMPCELLGGQCYYDGSTLLADEMVPKFIAGGTAWLWPELENIYRTRFEPEAV